MKTNDKFILDNNGEPVACDDLDHWAKWFEKADRKVAKSYVGTALIYTVFLGLNHNYGEGDPILWETLIIGGPLDNEMDRCCGSREQAEAMHALMVAKVKAVLSLCEEQTNK